MDNTELQQQIDQLNGKVTELTNIIGRGLEITRDISFEQQDAIRDIVKDKVSDMVWDDFFYTSQFDPVGSVITGGTAWQWSETIDQLSLSIKKETRLRVVLNVLTLGSGDLFITTAHVRPVDVSYTHNTTTGEYVGVKFDDSELYAVTSKKGKQSFNKLANLTQGDDYVIDIRFFPGERVDFYIDYVYAGSMTDNIPDDNNLEIYDAFFAEGITGATTNLDIQRVEFLQRNK